ncbi:hypothetical protein GCM10009526_30270 [Glutamicibacter creatinolyticus]
MATLTTQKQVLDLRRPKNLCIVFPCRREADRRKTGTKSRREARKINDFSQVTVDRRRFNGKAKTDSNHKEWI